MQLTEGAVIATNNNKLNILFGDMAGFVVNEGLRGGEAYHAWVNRQVGRTTLQHRQ
jgi:hypothetical protein